jgi:hypothetical protein
MKKVFVALCLAASVSATLRAELKYTIHMEVKKADVPAGQPVNPMISMMGDSMIKEMLPSGGADLVYSIGEKGSRVEYLQPAMGQPAGAVSISLPDGAVFMLNPKDQTYWKTTVQSTTAMMKAAGMAPTASVKRTGTFESVAGLKCELVTFDWKMDLPIPEAARATLPPDFPTAISMNGNTCLTTDQFQKYADLAAKSQMGALMSSLGLNQALQGGIALRQIVQIGGIELQSVVTSISEQDVPASAFEVPAGYKEVPAPVGVAGIK